MGKLIDLTGKKYGRLTVIKYVYNNNKNKRVYECVCECGNIVTVIGESLVNGNTQSCGCYKRDGTIKRCRKNLVGKKFKKLIVIEYAYTKNKRTYWKCKCLCGKECIKNGHLLVTGQIKNCGKCKLLKDEKPNIFNEIYIKNEKDKIIAENLTYGSNKKVWWRCEKGHIYKSSVKERTSGNNCPICRQSKGNKRISKFLGLKKINFVREKTFKECKDKRVLQFDFYLPDYNLLIEYQGEQHYTLGRYKDCEERFKGIQRRDQIKRDFCQDNNIELFEIKYTDFNKIEEILIRELNLCKN